MKLRTFLAGMIVGLAVLAGATAASAQANDPYTRRPTEVGGVEQTRDAGSVAGVQETTGQGQVQSTGLALTGGDIAGLALVGFGLTAAGVVLVRRSRSRLVAG